MGNTGSVELTLPLRITPKCTLRYPIAMALVERHIDFDVDLTIKPTELDKLRDLLSNADLGLFRFYFEYEFAPMEVCWVVDRAERLSEFLGQLNYIVRVGIAKSRVWVAINSVEFGLVRSMNVPLESAELRATVAQFDNWLDVFFRVNGGFAWRINHLYLDVSLPCHLRHRDMAQALWNVLRPRLLLIYQTPRLVYRVWIKGASPCHTEYMGLPSSVTEEAMIAGWIIFCRANDIV